MRTQYQDFLVHHGRLGQKWGVKNGPPYPLQLKGKSYGSVMKKKLTRKQTKELKKEFSRQSEKDKEETKNEKRELHSAGIHKGIFNDYLEKDKSLYRYSSTDKESLDNRRKYVSVTETDRRVYKNDAEANALSNKGKDVYLYEYTSKERIKIARAEKFIKDAIREYGDDDVKEAWKQTKIANVRKHYHKLNSELKDPSNNKRWMFDHAADNQEKVSKFLHDVLYDPEKSKKFYDKYYKKGYRAIVDPEDYSSGYYYPLIVLNPKESMVTKKVKRVR